MVRKLKSPSKIRNCEKLGEKKKKKHETEVDWLLLKYFKHYLNKQTNKTQDQSDVIEIDLPLL